MRTKLWSVVVAALLLAGCGSESSATSAKPESTPAEDDQQAGDVALRYIHAVADQDWKAACATRTDKEQREMAVIGGSCEKAFAAIFKGKPTDIFADVKVGDVRLEGSRAEVDLVQPGQSEPATTLVATKTAGEWRLIDE